MASWFVWQGEDLILQLYVQPAARRDALLGPYGDEYLRIALRAPPVDGKANAHLLRFLAHCFATPVRRIHLLGGSHNRRKRVRIERPVSLPPGWLQPCSDALPQAD